MIRTSKWTRFLYKLNFLGAYPRAGQYNKEWDDKLNSLMEKDKIVTVSGFTAIFSSGEEVWISNHPYASGYQWDIREASLHPNKRRMPSLQTLWKFEELVMNHLEGKGLKIERYK